MAVIDMDSQCNCPVCRELLTPRLNPMGLTKFDYPEWWSAGLDPRIDPMDMLTEDDKSCCDCDICLEICRLHKDGKETAKKCLR
jgi:hypothetical protein